METYKPMSKLAAWMNLHMSRLKITPEQLGDTIGVTRSSIYFYLNDTCVPRRNTFLKMCDAFGVPIAEANKLKLYEAKKHTRKV